MSGCSTGSGARQDRMHSSPARKISPGKSGSSFGFLQAHIHPLACPGDIRHVGILVHILVASGYLHEERHFSMVKSALWVLVTQAGGFLGYFTFGFAADSLGRRPAYSMYAVVRALGLAMVTIFWGPIAAYPGIILIFMFLVGFGTGMFGGYGPLFSELFPTDIRNTAMGSAFNLARGVQFLTPVHHRLDRQLLRDGGRHIPCRAFCAADRVLDLDVPRDEREEARNMNLRLYTFVHRSSLTH